MINLEAYEEHIAFLRIRINNLNAEERTGEKIRTIIKDSKLPDLSEEIVEEIARNLEKQYQVYQSFGSSVKAKSFKPWLNDVKDDIPFYYWPRFQQYLMLEENFPTEVVKTLDDTTDEILNFIGNPKSDGSFQRRGMVVGQVQSGKTSSYSSVICKAADAGYKIIILLTGMTNNLRRQTQDRINHAFIGQEAIFDKTTRNEAIGAGRYSIEKRVPVWGTTITADFSITAARNYGVHPSSVSEPLIFVTKKNPATLKNLLQYLQMYFPDGKNPHPLLLIDDEADNASINTKSAKDQITRINGGIRELLDQFERASYVAYTATPFANIFITPETNDEMYGEDLFPKDYIKMLEAPTNYVGPRRIFLEEGDLGSIMLRTPDDYQDILPLKHKNYWEVSALPESLKEAINVFLIARTIRCLQGNSNAHCSMMINVSVYNFTQNEVSNRVYEYLTEIKDSVRLHSKKEDGVNRSTVLANIREIYEREYFTENSSEFPEWMEVQHELNKAISSVIVKLANMSQGALEYDKYKDHGGLHVIAIGGYALSRGLTLEGLCVSYVLRNPAAYDTLMQMGRWFGYRIGYEHLCRLYIPDFTQEYLEYITTATDELGLEIERMDDLNLTPLEFGLKIREHPASIRITAKNKMDSAQLINVSINYAAQHKEGYALFNNYETNQTNIDFVKDFMSRLTKLQEHPDVHHTELFWNNVDVDNILDLLSKFKLPKSCNDFYRGDKKPSLIEDYIADRKLELNTWDVSIPEIEKNRQYFGIHNVLPGRAIRARGRRSGDLLNDGKIFRPTRGANRVADKIDSKIGILNTQLNEITGHGHDKIYNYLRNKPLLLIHFFEAGLKDKKISEGDCLEMFVSISICFPTSVIKAPEKQYQVNQVWSQMNFLDDLNEIDPDFEEQEMEIYA